MVLAYTYDADTHCPRCATDRFGRDRYGFVPVDATDSEENPVDVINTWDEWWNGDNPQTLVCGTCGAILATHE